MNWARIITITIAMTIGYIIGFNYSNIVNSREIAELKTQAERDLSEDLSTFQQFQAQVALWKRSAYECQEDRVKELKEIRAALKAGMQ